MQVKFIVIFFLCCSHLIGQEITNDSVGIFKKRKTILHTSLIGTEATSLVLLNRLWYKEGSDKKFKFFNDNKEWLQIDKVGHAFSNYQLSKVYYPLFKWAGYSKNKSLLYSSLYNIGWFAAIETMDGFGKGYGFSWGDIGANLSGNLFFSAQEYFFDDQIFKLKYSFSPSGFAQYRPNLLGKNFGEQIIKDYNGQTYWLSFSPFSFFKNEQIKKYSWLCLSLGYGGMGMLSGLPNQTVVLNDQLSIINYERSREYYLSLDIDLEKIKVKNKLLQSIFRVVNVLKVPLPSLKLSNGRVGWAVYN
jgi:Predicted periplasmic lipoprotein (DUF2279)